MNCPDCGHEIEKGASACGSCGMVLAPEAASLSLPEADSHTVTSGESLPVDRQRLPRKINCNLDINKIKKGAFFRRALAFYFDLMLQGFIVLIFCITGLATLKKGLAMSGHEMGLEDTVFMAGPLLLAALIINAGYFTFFHWATGQTPGKKLNNLKVITIDGETPGALPSFVRWAGYFLSAIPFMLGFFLAIIDDQKQALHDKFAGTYVVDTNDIKKV